MLVEERSAAIPVPHASSGTALLRARPVPGAVALVAVSVALAALTLVLPSAPTYDPWAWIVWGREITHLDLQTTLGPSWKPLPVAFTTVFSLFGPVAPDLWLVVARAGAIAALVLAFRVARRLGGGVVGGVIAAAALVILPWWFRNAALGNSEGLIVAFLLAAIDRELAGRRRFAFAMAVCAALLRPEAWPFLALYGLFLMWRRELSPRLVIGAGIGVLALWTLPEWWGSGDPLRAMHRAKDVNAGAPTYADNPALETLREARAMLSTQLLVALGAAAAMLVARRDRMIAVLAVMAVAWLALVAYMTSDGFSGNQRYLIAPVVLTIVLAGAGGGWLAQRAAELVLPHRVRTGAAATALAVVASAAAAALFVSPSVDRFSLMMDNLQYQGDLLDELPGLVRDAGGAARLNACGDPYTGPFLVPAVAWYLHRHTADVHLAPSTPAVVFRVRTIPQSRPIPTLRDVGDTRSLATGDNWRIVAACRGSAG